jgi:hypothetical protein
MIQQIKKRWQAKESKIGNFIKIFFGYVLGVCMAAESVLEFTHLVPEEWIPQEMKYAIAIMAFIGFVTGKMTKRKEDEPTRPQDPA